MLKMRLQRVGRKNDPSYRVVVTDSRTGPKSGKHVDHLGSYEPKSGKVQIDGARAKDWIAKGVQPSGTVHNMLVSQNIIEGKKVNVLPKKSPIIDEEAQKAAAETEAAKKAAEEAAAAAPADLPAEDSAQAGETAPTEEAPTAEAASETEETAAEVAEEAPAAEPEAEGEKAA